MIKKIILLFIVLTPVISFGESSNNYFPVGKDSFWRYKLAPLTDTSFDANGKYKGEYVNYSQYNLAEHGFEIFRDSTILPNCHEIQLKTYGYTQAGDKTAQQFYYYWKIKGDTVLITKKNIGDTDFTYFVHDFIGGNNGQIAVDERKDTVRILPPQTIITPAGTFSCLVTEAVRPLGLILSPLVDAHPEVTKIVTYKAANVGIVRVVSYRNGKMIFLYDLSYYHIFSSTTLNKNPTPTIYFAEKSNFNNSIFSFNVLGKKFENSQISRVPSYLYNSRNKGEIKLGLN